MLWRFFKSKVLACMAALQGRPAQEQPYRREAEARRRTAADRAEKQLLAHLTAEQRETYRQCGWFLVRGQSGRRYSILTKDALYYNVRELDDYGRIVSRLCAHAAANIPLGDQLLTQKLMLEHHESEFRRIANLERREVEFRRVASRGGRPGL